MTVSIVIMCMILILLMVIMVAYNIGFYQKLRKDTWACSEMILCIFFALSLTFLTVGVFIDYKTDIRVIPIYFMILFFEFVWLLSIYSRMFTDSELIGSIILILTSAEIILLLKKDYKELAILATPFLFFALLQMALSDTLYKNNIDHIDLLKIIQEPVV